MGKTIVSTDTPTAYPLTFHGRQSLLLQASRYGTQVANLEDNGMEDDRRAVRKAYMAFRNQFSDDRILKEITDEYWTAYELG